MLVILMSLLSAYWFLSYCVQHKWRTKRFGFRQKLREDVNIILPFAYI